MVLGIKEIPCMNHSHLFCIFSLFQPKLTYMDMFLPLFISVETTETDVSKEVDLNLYLWIMAIGLHRSPCLYLHCFRLKQLILSKIFVMTNAWMVI